MAIKLERLEAALAAREGDDWVLLERANAAEAALEKYRGMFRDAEDQARILLQDREKLAELQSRWDGFTRSCAQMGQRAVVAERQLAEARGLLQRVPAAEWMRDSCPYGCTGNKCPWCGAEQHLSGHEHGCLVPLARAFLAGEKP
jgi:hypothetical protein